MADTTEQRLGLPLGPNNELIGGRLVTNKNGDAEWYKTGDTLPTLKSNKDEGYTWKFVETNSVTNLRTTLNATFGADTYPTNNDLNQQFYSDPASINSLNSARLNTFQSPTGFNSPQLAKQVNVPGSTPATSPPAPARPPGPSDPTDPSASQSPITNTQLTEQKNTIKSSNSTLSSIETDAANPLRYPLNNSFITDEDILKIEIYEYKESGLGADDVQSFKLKSMTDRLEGQTANTTVYLPASNQSGIIDSLTVGWGSGELNPVTAQFARTALNTIGGAGDPMAALKTFTDGLSDNLKNLANATELKTLVTNYFTEQAVQTTGLLSRTAGAAINNNVELLFTGVQLRDFTLTYRLTPRSKPEAEMIKKIIRAFKISMSPALSDSALFLLAPCVYKLTYLTAQKQDHPYLHKFKACALKGFNVNYTPDGNYMTYADGKSMTQYELQFSFGEIDPIYRNDYDSIPEGQSMGY